MSTLKLFLFFRSDSLSSSPEVSTIRSVLPSRPSLMGHVGTETMICDALGASLAICIGKKIIIGFHES
ncbi:hypothetical protein E2C01_040718 [Portunus trituberculatus]|uniref:Uncharacterized protein n=1 Tax=Portunus trituberculatus TaxID=210409 RepID=A0A5B7FRI7_PORTR|nr:hypothetical protein [Portunus trituberculatus]